MTDPYSGIDLKILNFNDHLFLFHSIHSLGKERKKFKIKVLLLLTFKNVFKSSLVHSTCVNGV